MGKIHFTSHLDSCSLVTYIVPCDSRAKGGRGESDWMDPSSGEQSTPLVHYSWYERGRQVSLGSNCALRSAEEKTGVLTTGPLKEELGTSRTKELITNL